MATVPKAPAGHFNILYFAAASSFTTKQHESFPAPLPLGKLFSTLEERYAGFQAKILDSCLVTLNLNYVDMPPAGEAAAPGEEEVVIKEGDEVAIIPPVSSG